MRGQRNEDLDQWPLRSLCAAFVEYVERGLPVRVSSADTAENELEVTVAFRDAQAFRRLVDVWVEFDRQDAVELRQSEPNGG